jgi:hypothetical protein
MANKTQHRIQFKKPDLETLTNHFTVVDMHFHTHHSDGHNSVDEISELRPSTRYRYRYHRSQCHPRCR